MDSKKVLGEALGDLYIAPIMTFLFIFLRTLISIKRNSPAEGVLLLLSPATTLKSSAEQVLLFISTREGILRYKSVSRSSPF